MGMIGNLENEQMIESLGDMIEPIMKMREDRKVVELAQKKNLPMLAVYLCKNHSKEIVDVLAALEGTPRDKYKLTIPKLIKALTEIKADEDMLAFFTASSQTEQ